MRRESLLKSRCVATSLVLVGLVLTAWGMSWWRSAGWLRTDETWVAVPASGMQELHTTTHLAVMLRGRFELSRTETIHAVIPIGSSAARAPMHTTGWLWQPALPLRARPWDDRWHVTRWDEWRLGDFGWYQTTGGGAESRVFSIPLWLVLALAGTPCWIWLAAHLRARRRRKQGRCPVCGYHLRGLTPGAACPECGKNMG